MNQKEIDLVWELLKNKTPNNCLEWGCGFSTLYFPKLLKGSFNWLSVEHSEEWVNEIRQKSLNPNVSVVHVNPDIKDHSVEGTEAEFKSYIEYPGVNSKYDFILIDGRARKYCVKKAIDLITDDGILLIHDANRKSYLEFTDAFNFQVCFTDYRRTAGGLWIGSKKQSLDELIDIDHHKKAWEIQTKIGRIIRFRFIREKFKSFD